jgi:hypothetical protein
MDPRVYDMTCLLCGTQVGELRGGRFYHHAGCTSAPTVRAGILRCCRCGGSLYMERSDAISASLGRRSSDHPLSSLARAS